MSVSDYDLILYCIASPKDRLVLEKSDVPVHGAFIDITTHIGSEWTYVTLSRETAMRLRDHLTKILEE